MSRPLRILWIYQHANTFGGSFNSVLDLLDRRDPAAFEVIGALPAPGTSADEFSRRGVRPVFAGEVPAERSWAYLRSVVAFARLLRRERIDVVYVTDYVSWRSSALTAASLTKTPYVVHVRSPLPDDVPLDPSLFKAAAVVGNSRATIRALEPHVSSGQLAVIYNFIDFERFAAGRDIRSEFFPEAPRVVGFVGFVRPEKGVEYYLQMARIVHDRRPDVRFLVVGAQSTVKDDGWFERMRAYSTELGLDRVLHFAGSRRDVENVMASLDVLVVPSLNEGFGRVIIEANAAGKPVIGADAAGIPEVIEDGVTGLLVPPRDGGALAQAVLRVLDDREPWLHDFARRVPGRVRERFAPARQVRALEDVFRRASGVEQAGKQPA